MSPDGDQPAAHFAGSFLPGLGVLIREASFSALTYVSSALQLLAAESSAFAVDTDLMCRTRYNVLTTDIHQSMIRVSIVYTLRRTSCATHLSIFAPCRSSVI